MPAKQTPSNPKPYEVKSAQEVVKILTAVKKLVSKPASWTKKTNARNVYGQEVSYEDADATCFCLNGAVNRATFRINCYYDVYVKIRESLQEAAGTANLIAYNDDLATTHKDIINMLNKALRKTRTVYSELNKQATSVTPK